MCLLSSLRADNYLMGFYENTNNVRGSSNISNPDNPLVPVGESWPTAAIPVENLRWPTAALIPMENPYRSCRL